MASKVVPQDLAALRNARHDDRQRSGEAGPNRYSAHREQDLPERMLDRRVVGCLLRLYFRLYHRIECHGLAKIPSTGPVLVLISHFSFLDGVSLLAFDTRGGQTAGVIKESLLHLPLIGRLLHR